MEHHEKVTRLKEILANARGRRGLVAVNDSAVAIALADALQSASLARLAIDYRQNNTAYPIRRKQLLSRLAVQMKHYGMTEEVEAFVSTAGGQTIYGLDLDQLEALQAWMAQCIDDQATACDSRYAPPAR